MTRNRLIVLQAVGLLSILPYPFVLIATISSLAAPGRTEASSIAWALMLFYPAVWIALYVVSWRAMNRGANGLAFGLSSVPAFACLIAFAVYLFSWIGFALGSAGIGSGGLHSRTFPTNNPVIDSLVLAGQDLQIGHEPERAAARTLQEVQANPKLMNVSLAPYGSPLNLALRNLNAKPNGDQQTAARDALARSLTDVCAAIIKAGGRLSADEEADPAEMEALKKLFDREPSLRTLYTGRAPN